MNQEKAWNIAADMAGDILSHVEEVLINQDNQVTSIFLQMLGIDVLAVIIAGTDDKNMAEKAIGNILRLARQRADQAGSGTTYALN